MARRHSGHTATMLPGGGATLLSSLPWSGGWGSIKGDQVLLRCVRCIQCMLGSWRRDIEGTSSSLLSPDTPQIGPTPTIQMFDTHSRNAKFQHCQRIEKKMIFHLLAFYFSKAVTKHPDRGGDRERFNLMVSLWMDCIWDFMLI